jgi:hypothetical protein
MNRLDVLKEKFEIKMDDENYRRIDIAILLDEIHKRDLLINDFREQIKKLKLSSKE